MLWGTQGSSPTPPMVWAPPSLERPLTAALAANNPLWNVPILLQSWSHHRAGLWKDLIISSGKRGLWRSYCQEPLSKALILWTFWEIFSRICLQCRRPGFNPWVRKIPWRWESPFQYSCLENSMDREAWWAIVHEVTNSQTWLTLLKTQYRHFSV